MENIGKDIDMVFIDSAHFESGVISWYLEITKPKILNKEMNGLLILFLI